MLQVFHGFSKSIQIEAKDCSHPENGHDEALNVLANHLCYTYHLFFL